MNTNFSKKTSNKKVQDEKLDKLGNASTNETIGDENQAVKSFEVLIDQLHMGADEFIFFPDQKQSYQLFVKEQTSRQDQANDFSQFDVSGAENQMSEKLINCLLSKEEDRIFESKNTKKLTIKNTNIPKFIVKTFRDWVHANQDKLKHFYTDEVSKRQLQNAISPISSKGQNQFKVEHLRKLFGEYGLNTCEFKKINRRLLNHILRKDLKSQVIEKMNIKQKNKISYLIASKVFALRCMRSSLTSRVQSR